MEELNGLKQGRIQMSAIRTLAFNATSTFQFKASKLHICSATGKIPINFMLSDHTYQRRAVLDFARGFFCKNIIETKIQKKQSYKAQNSQCLILLRLTRHDILGLF
ncbi:hypothetical protein V8G54_017669 [Vigna mungo]|uniref:Uncharacterized protein n=1 Tax=Vigna mungo TaxID=3915 RepID=A0AAQ3NMK9_VIGMU